MGDDTLLTRSLPDEEVGCRTLPFFTPRVVSGFVRSRLDVLTFGLHYSPLRKGRLSITLWTIRTPQVISYSE